jgi:SAM-dependent methyltransferase
MSLRNAARVHLPAWALLPAREGWRTLRTLPVRGRRYLCPCCNRRFRSFLPGGDSLRENARCAACDSLERHRLIALYLRREPDLLERPLEVLHVAPEPALARLFERNPRCRYRSADLASPLADDRVDLEGLPYEANRFDLILCNHVLEHVEDDRRAMRELFRVLRPGGLAILQSPVDAGREESYEDPSIRTPEDRLRAFGQQDHVRIYGTDYVQRLRSAGFDVSARRYAEEIGGSFSARCRLDPQELLYLCRK